MIKAKKLYQIANQGPVDKISFVLARTPLDPNLCFTGGIHSVQLPQSDRTAHPEGASHISCKSDLAGREELASEEDVLFSSPLNWKKCGWYFKNQNPSIFHKSAKISNFIMFLKSFQASMREDSSHFKHLLSFLDVFGGVSNFRFANNPFLFCRPSWCASPASVKGLIKFAGWPWMKQRLCFSDGFWLEIAPSILLVRVLQNQRKEYHLKKRTVNVQTSMKTAWRIRMWSWQLAIIGT